MLLLFYGIVTLSRSWKDKCGLFDVSGSVVIDYRSENMLVEKGNYAPNLVHIPVKGVATSA